MKQVITKSGIRGYQCPLQSNYNSFIEFKAYSDTYGLAARLGFKAAKEAWGANPVIQGSTKPEDFRIAPVKEQAVQDEGFTGGEWKLDATFYHIENTCITDKNGNTIAECYRNAYHKDRTIAAANAKRIVECVNAHDELVKAVKYSEKVAYDTSKENAKLIGENKELREALQNLHTAAMQVGITEWWQRNSDTVAKAKELLNK